MKNKSILISMLAFSCMIATGCSGNAENNSNNANSVVEGNDTESGTDDSSAEDSNATDGSAEDSIAEDSDNTETTENADSENGNSIQQEVDEIEKMYQEYENGDWDLPQQEMNMKSAEVYALWDDELNLLWNELTEELTEDEKNEVLDEQRQWIKRKDMNVIASGAQAYGGTLQPLLENTTASTMTRKRVYELAGKLAEEKNQKFTISNEINESFGDVDLSINEILQTFVGTHILTDEMNLVVSTASDAKSEGVDVSMVADDNSIVVWYPDGPVLTESDAYGYTNDVVVYLKDNTYYVLQKGWEGDAVVLTSGEDLMYLDMVGD